MLPQPCAGFLRTLGWVRGRRVPRHGPWCADRTPAPPGSIVNLRVGGKRRTVVILDALDDSNPALPLFFRREIRPDRAPRAPGGFGAAGAATPCAPLKTIFKKWKALYLLIRTT
eukprot:6212557-Pleurochrysis_carterae.AAC.1